jgi:hypothetical protein
MNPEASGACGLGLCFGTPRAARGVADHPTPRPLGVCVYKSGETWSRAAPFLLNSPPHHNNPRRLPPTLAWVGV